MPVEAQRPASFQIKKWGLVHGWLAGGLGRQVVIEASAGGMSVRIEDPVRGVARETIGVDEDPSGAAWRAITRLERG